MLFVDCDFWIVFGYFGCVCVLLWYVDCDVVVFCCDGYVFCVLLCEFECEF